MKYFFLNLNGWFELVEKDLWSRRKCSLVIICVQNIILKTLFVHKLTKTKEREALILKLYFK